MVNGEEYLMRSLVKDGELTEAPDRDLPYGGRNLAEGTK